MDRRSNCYLNSAYNRNIDDFDDYIDNLSQHSFGSRGRLYESENETFVDAYLDDQISCCSDDDRLAAFDESHIGNRSYSLQQLQRYHQESLVADTGFDHVTSTPKKHQPSTPFNRKNPHRRAAIARHRSFSIPNRSDGINSFVENRYHAAATIRRSKSSVSLQPRLDQSRYAMRMPIRGPRYASDRQYDRNALNMTEPILRLPNINGTATATAATAATPFHIKRKPVDIFTVRNSFLRRPYDPNSSFSSCKPLMARNTAVISPIYQKPTPSPFDANNRRNFSCSPEKSMASSKNSWLQMREQSLPLCTLRTSAITLLVSGTLTCLLCIHIMSQRGKSYELNFSLISGFVTLCLGFPCLRFQEWQWVPNRNYVSGYVILSLFSLLQSTALWLLDKYPDMQPEYVDITKGALCGISILALSMALFGVCASCCCKYPPPDNRVAHGVRGFTV